jgi:glycosyltransferase involved in cell wall biosynthesis
MDGLDELQRTGASVHTHDVHSRRGMVVAAARGAAMLRAVVDRERPDVVLHAMVGPLTARTLWGLRGAEVPIVSVIHDASPHPGDRHVALDYSTRYAVGHSDALIAPSAFVAGELRRLYFSGRGSSRSSARIGVVALGPQRKMAPGWDPGGHVLAFGRLLPYKGLDLLADAWEQLEAPRLPLRIVGSGRDDLPELARLTALGAEVRNEWVPDSQLGDVMKGSRLVVLPYREASQSGVVTLALGSAIPVLTTNVGGLAEQVGDGGLVVDATADSLAAGLRRLLQDPSQLRALHDVLSRWPSFEERWDELADQTVAFLSTVSAPR